MSVKDKTKIPKYFELMNPFLKSINELGGSGTNEEIYNKVVENEKFTDEQLSILHNPEKDSRTEINYRLDWAKTYLKKFGLIDNSSKRGVWSLTKQGKDTSKVIPEEVINHYRGLCIQSQGEEICLEKDLKDKPEELLDTDVDWKSQLHQILLSISPDAFERLTQRILREAGFIEVEVTGRTGDGGIDGKGILKLNDMFNFRVLFQCKRHKGSIGSPDIRNFRGATEGRADKRLFITTGSFTRDAIKEAYRDGVPSIDLLDGEQLLEKLKELSLGLKVKTIEEVEIDKGWFEEL
jgi:restriction system protein